MVPFPAYPGAKNRAGCPIHCDAIGGGRLIANEHSRPRHFGAPRMGRVAYVFWR